VFPLAAVAAGLVVFPIDFILEMVGLSGGGLTARYLAFANAAFAPTALPTWIPRAVLLVLLVVVVAAIVAASVSQDSRRRRGRIWWRWMRSPLSSSTAIDHSLECLWDLIRGATQQGRPHEREIATRYTDLLSENLGQPGFRELMIVAHDVDAHADTVFALVAEARRRDLLRRPTTTEVEARKAAVVDLAGIGREHLVDALAASLAIPLATEMHTLTFAPDSYWRGESHRLCDRPGTLARLVAELTRLDVKQIILVSASPAGGGPHRLERAVIEGRARLGEYLQSAEAAAVSDVGRFRSDTIPLLFTVQPGHNPVGPFDFEGGFDDRSDRRQPLEELMARGYEDAYRQFIEPVVGASGERVGMA
jgi:hypothetical protein